MLNIKEEVQICLLRKGMSMRKVSKILRAQGKNFPLESGLSTMFNKKRIKFDMVQEILDYLGYELVIKEK